MFDLKLLKFDCCFIFVLALPCSLLICTRLECVCAVQLMLIVAALLSRYGFFFNTVGTVRVMVASSAATRE